MTIDVEAFAGYLNELFGRLVDHRFASSTEFFDITAPEGVNAMFAADPKTRTVHSARVLVHPAISTGALTPIVERRMDLGDATSRLLIKSTGREAGPNGPSRVTIATRTADLESTDGVGELLVMRPDRFTSPTGITLGMVLDHDDKVSDIDLASVLSPKSTLRRLAEFLDGHDQLTGLRWCDDAARLFGVEPIAGTFFGAPPHFIPILSVGIDSMTLGLLWDRPEAGVLDDSTLHLVSPGGQLVLESKVPLKGWIVARLRDELEGASRAQADQLNAAIRLVGARIKSAELGPISRRRGKPRDLSNDERWAPHATGGDAVRAPSQVFADETQRDFEDGWAALEVIQEAMRNGHPGSALHAAGSGLHKAAMVNDAAAIHALYHAMIEPLEALGRGAIADRCRSLTAAAAPIVSTPPPPPAPPTPVLAAPMRGNRESFDATAELGQPEPLVIAHNGTELAVEVSKLAPLNIDDVPGDVLIWLLDSGAVSVDTQGRCTSAQDKPILATVHDDHLVATSVWEQPGVTGLHVEAVVPWSTDETRYRLVHYVALRTKNSPFDDGVLQDAVRFADRSELQGWSSEPSEWIAQMHKAGPHGHAKAAELDVLHSQYHFRGMIVSHRAAEIMTESGDVDTLAVKVGSKKLDFRFIGLPLRSDYDWERSTFVITEGLLSPVIIDRPERGSLTNIDDFHAIGDELDEAEGYRSCKPNVVVLHDTPPVMSIFGIGPLVRADIRDQMLQADLVGFQLGEQSGFFLVQ